MRDKIGKLFFQERNKPQTSEADELKSTAESGGSGYKRSRREKRKPWDRGGYSDNEKRASRSGKRTASGSSVCDRNSTSSEDSQDNDEGAAQGKRSSVGAEVVGGKSASLIEWSRFEESAAKLSVGVSDEDKQSVASEDRKLRDSDECADSVLACGGAKIGDGETEVESGAVERCASQMVKKMLGSPSIAEKLQEKLFGLGRSSEDCKDTEEASPEAISETTSEKLEDSLEVGGKTEESSRMPKDYETSSTIAKECVGVKNVNFETSHDRTRNPNDGDGMGDSKISDFCGSEKDEEHEKDRPESPIVNKSPLRAEPKHYGKQYSPKVVLYNLVLPPGKILRGKIKCLTKDIASSKCSTKDITSSICLTKDIAASKKLPAEEEKCFLSPAEPMKANEISPAEEHTFRVPSFEDNGRNLCSESLLKNRLEVSVIDKTYTSYDSESSGQKSDVTKEESIINSDSHFSLLPPSYDPNVVQIDKVDVLQNDPPTGLKGNVGLSDNSSESGDSDIVTDSSKRIPEHGYSRCSIDDSLSESNTKAVGLSKMENTNNPSEQTEVVAEEDLEQDRGVCSLSVAAPAQEKASVLEPVEEDRSELEPVQGKNNALEPVKERDHMLESVWENGSTLEAVQETDSASGPVEEVVQSCVENLEAEAVMCTKPVGKEVIASETPSGAIDAVCISQNKAVIDNSVSNPADMNADPLEEKSEEKSPAEETNTNKCSEANGIEQSEGEVSDKTNKVPTCSDSDKVGFVASSGSSGDNSDVSINLTARQTAMLKVYPAKTVKALDKKIKDGKTNELATLQNDETVAPATVVTPPAGKEELADRTDHTDSSGVLGKKIKEEPLDPDELAQESSSADTSALSNCHNLAKTLPELKQRSSPAEKTEADADKFNKGRAIVNKKLNLAMLEDKDRLTNNDSPSSVSDKDGIFPSLFLDPSITITVINDKPGECVEVPGLSKSKTAGPDINVNELRASVNLSKDISLTVVGAAYSGHCASSKGSSSGAVASLDMECDHESDHDESRISSTDATSGQVPLTGQNVVTGQNNIGKQKKQRPLGASETLHARSRARKSFPNRPPFTSIKVKSHPELVNGVGSLGSKSSVQRRNSAGTNSNSSDSRRSSYGTSPQEILISSQQSGETNADNFGATDNKNNPSSAMVVLPPVLGTPGTNHIQALRTVNSSIGSPSHLMNGGSDIMPSRMMSVPHSQTHTVGSGSRISPAGQGPGAAAGASRLPPQLQPRPPGPLLSQHPPSIPSEAGPVSAELNRHTHKVCVFL
jgi:hypothetical protein